MRSGVWSVYVYVYVYVPLKQTVRISLGDKTEDPLDGDKRTNPPSLGLSNDSCAGHHLGQ